jgi:thiosulfate/3-mercaptopyruvate sulfurtransferase
MIVTPAWLAERLADPQVVVIHVSHDDFAAGHVPGARDLPYDDIVTRTGGLSAELPAADQLRERFAQLGVSDRTTVVVYAHQAPMATRVLFSLAYIGHERIAYLDGGLERWREEGREVTRGADASSSASASTSAARGALTLRTNTNVVADAEWIQSRLGNSQLAWLDTRTTGEYVGSGNRSGMPSAGHLAGAVQLEWQDLFEDRSVRLKPRAELEAIYRERVGSATEVVTYCWVGYRASATWFIARALGYEARMYDGSYQDWQARALPTRGGSTP